MAKTKSMYKCGRCGELGHNARTCKRGTNITVKGAPAEAEAKPKTESDRTIPMDATQDLTADRRGPSDRPANAPSPFECPTCLRVGILALVEIEGGAKQLRCEYCHTKARVTLILKWGALPSDKPAVG